MGYDVYGNPVGDTELILSAKKLGLHLMPNSEGELNAVRRARQFTDIKWTPCTQRYRGQIVEYDETITVKESFVDRFLADTEYTGIPYSRGDTRSSGMPAYGKDHGYVGFDVSIDTFVSAATNPDTYFSASSYYATGNNACYTPYGVTCDTLVDYAWGFTTWYGSDAGFTSLINNGIITYVCNGDTIATTIDQVHLGDALVKIGTHVAIITDIVTDDNGNVFIEISEATPKGATDPDTIGGQKGGVSRRELWSMDLYPTRFNGYTVYRYTGIDSVEYEQSPFVTLQGESPMHNLRDRLPLMPYMGDRFVYKVGKIANDTIVIGSASYDYMAVYKDGSLFNTFTLNGATSVSVGFTASGEYEAFLYDSSDGTVANMTARTVSCEWTVKA